MMKFQASYFAGWFKILVIWVSVKSKQDFVIFIPSIFARIIGTLEMEMKRP